jgi:2-oxo-4-hydroxy-4-carboxy-5-ureidoimidazoline decarboxylase
MTPRPTLEELNRMPREAFLAALGDVFEHAPWVTGSVVDQRPFASVDALHTAMLASVRALPEDQLVALLAGHPALAGAAARAGTMTADSTKEQGALALEKLPGEQMARWDALNAAYQDKFGFPFIICVRRHTLASVLRSFEKRLARDRAAELVAAVEEIARVSRLRLAARVENHALPGIAGMLTTHVLDAAHGRPAPAVRVELFETSANGSHAIAQAVTNGDGRTRPLLEGTPLRIGTYELRFHVGDYFRAIGAAVNDTPFLDVVPIAFGIGEAEGHYHVPISITPWAYSTYRGS